MYIQTIHNISDNNKTNMSNRTVVWGETTFYTVRRGQIIYVEKLDLSDNSTSSTAAIPSENTYSRTDLHINSTGYLYLIYTNSGTEELKYIKSTNPGDSTAWGSPVVIQSVNGSYVMGISMSPSDSLWFSYWGGAPSGDMKLRELNSSDVLQAEISIDNLTIYYRKSGNLHIDSAGNIYLSVILSLGATTTERAIVVIRSTDNGVTWETPDYDNTWTAVTLPLTTYPNGTPLSAGEWGAPIAQSGSVLSTKYLVTINSLSDNTVYFGYHDGAGTGEDGEYHIANFIVGTGWNNKTVTSGDITADSASAVSFLIVDKDDNIYYFYNKTNTGPIRLLYSDNAVEFQSLNMLQSGTTYIETIDYLYDSSGYVDHIALRDCNPSTSLLSYKLMNTVSFKNRYKIIGGKRNTYYSFPGQTTCPNGDLLIIIPSGSGHATPDKTAEQFRSVDGGERWTYEQTAYDPTDATYGAQAAVVNTVGSDMFLWTRDYKTGSPGVRRISKSPDNGVTWGAHTDVTSQHSSTENPWVTLSNGDVLHVGHDSTAPIWCTVYRSLAADTARTTWTLLAIVTTAGVDMLEPTIAYNENNGKLVMVARNQTDANGDFKISTSTDADPTTWSAFSDIGTTGHKNKPFLIYTADFNCLILIFGNRRIGGAGVNEMFGWQYVYSLDDGTTWKPGEFLYYVRPLVEGSDMGYATASRVPNTNYINTSIWLTDDLAPETVLGQVINGFLTWDSVSQRLFPFKHPVVGNSAVEIIKSNAINPALESPAWTPQGTGTIPTLEFGVNNANLYMESFGYTGPYGWSDSTAWTGNLATGDYTIQIQLMLITETVQAAKGVYFELSDGTSLLSVSFHEGYVTLNDGSSLYVDMNNQDNVSSWPSGFLEIVVSGGVYSARYNGVTLRTSIAFSASGNDRIYFGNEDGTAENEVYWGRVTLLPFSITGGIPIMMNYYRRRRLV